MNNNKRIRNSKLEDLKKKVKPISMGRFLRYLIISISTCISTSYLLWCYVVFDIQSREPTPTIRTLGILIIFATFILMCFGIYNMKTTRSNHSMLKDIIDLSDIQIDETLKINEKLGESKEVNNGL